MAQEQTTEQPSSQTEGSEEQQKGAPSAEPAEKDDLDSLLAEYEKADEESQSQPATTEQKPDTPRRDEFHEVLQFARSEMSRRQREDFDARMTAGVEEMRKVEGFERFPERFLRDFLHGEAADNTPVGSVLKRGFDKGDKEWRRAVRAAASELAKEQVDPQVTQDREAARAAVRGQSTREPAEPSFEQEVNNMTDAEFEDWKRRKGIQRDGWA